MISHALIRKTNYKINNNYPNIFTGEIYIGNHKEGNR